MSKSDKIKPELAKSLKAFAKEHGRDYQDVLDFYQENLEDVRKKYPNKSGKFHLGRVFLRLRKSVTRRGGKVVAVQGIVLDQTNIFDVTAPRRFYVIKTAKEAFEKDNNEAIEQMIQTGQINVVPVADIEAELLEERAKDELDRMKIRALEKRKEDGLIVRNGKKFAIVPLETRQFFDKEKTRKNPNYGKPVTPVDIRRIFLIGRMVTDKDVTLPTLLAVEARHDQAHDFDFRPWSIITGNKLAVQDTEDDLIKFRVRRNCQWKTLEDEFVGDLLEAVGLEEINSDKSRTELLMSAPDRFKLFINDIFNMYDTDKWKSLMSNYDRFSIVIADILTKLDFTIGFRDEYLAIGQQPDTLDLSAPEMNFWVPKHLGDEWQAFGGGRVIFTGQLFSRNIWDEEAGEISSEEEPCMVVGSFAVIPEFREEVE